MKKVLSLFLVLFVSMTMWGATSSVPENAPDVMLQAFYWDSYPANSSNLGYGNTGWSALLSQVDEIGEYFDLVWLPPCSQSSGGTGYIPKQYSNLNSDWGSETDLRSLISKLKAKNTRAVADIVINHVTGNYGWCSFATMDFGSYGKFNPQASWICNTDEMNTDSGAGDCKGKATGAADDGYGSEANYSAARDWDHNNATVRAMCSAYLKWLKNDVGFDGWRYDYGKGFHHSHINEYNSAAGAYMAVVEYWDGNSGVIRSRLEDANWNEMAFDFGTKYNALNDGICSFDYSKCKGAGMLGAGLSKHAVTFVDNHDTFTRNGSEFGGQNKSMTEEIKDRLLQANAYILSMPGIPCVFYPHWVTYKDAIKPMIEARHLVGVHSQSEVKDEYAEQGGYQATIVGKNGWLILQLGNKVGGSFDGFSKKASGNGYAIWVKTNTVDAFYLTGNAALVGDKSWKADAIKVTGNTYTFSNLAADKDYQLKVTVDGTWNTAKGFSDLTTIADGLSGDNEGNICFSLSEAGDVKVTYTGAVFKLEGKFATSGSGSGGGQTTTKFYITGNDALVGESKAWDPAAIASTEDSYTIENLATGKDYKMKITTDGTWNTAKGYNDLTTQTDGLSADGDGNICFSLSEAGSVKVTYTSTVFKVEGKFVTSGSGSGDDSQPVDSVTVYFLNALNWTKVNAFVWPASGNALKAWPGEAAKKEADKLQGFDVYSYRFPKTYVNIIFNDGSTQTIDLTWSESKPYFYPAGKDGEKVKGTWHAKADVPSSGSGSGDDPQQGTAKFYITGDSALVVDAGLEKAKAWNPAAIKSEKDTFELDLKANQYYILKVTLNGTWEGENNVKGYNELTEKTEGLVDDSNDHNIGFKLSEAGKVQVIYTTDKDNKTIFKLAGKFATEGGSGDDPEQPGETVTVYFVNNVNWETVNAYVWYGDGIGYKDWPGEVLTKVSAQTGVAKREAKKSQDVDVYSYTFPKEYVNIIFNNGSAQTVDLQWNANKPYFYPEGMEGTKVKGTWYAKEDVPAGGEPIVTPEDGYYLLGTINEWTPVAAYLFTVNPANANEYFLNVTLAAGDKFKVAKVENGAAKTWYPDGMDNDYVVDAGHAGEKTIYFQTTYNAEWEAFGGYFYIAPNTATDIDTVVTAEQATKLFRDGQLFILRGTRIYTAQGQLVR